MPEAPETAGADRVRETLATLVEAGATRIELAATEIAEARLQLARQAMYAAAAMFFCGVGVVLCIALLVYVAPPAYRVAVLALATLAVFVLAGASLWFWRSIARARPAPLQATLDVLRADAAALRPSRRSEHP